jgi:hypothetical protein
MLLISCSASDTLASIFSGFMDVFSVAFSTPFFFFSGSNSFFSPFFLRTACDEETEEE